MLYLQSGPSVESAVLSVNQKQVVGLMRQTDGFPMAINKIYSLINLEGYTHVK
jgi:hypothetical protein